MQVQLMHTALITVAQYNAFQQAVSMYEVTHNNSLNYLLHEAFTCTGSITDPEGIKLSWNAVCSTGKLGALAAAAAGKQLPIIYT